MARATYTDLLSWYGEVYPAPTAVWNQTALTNMIAVAETLTNSETYPESIPDSGEEAKQITCMVTSRLIKRANLEQTGDQAAVFYKIFSDDIMRLIDNLLANTIDPIIATTVDQIEE